MKRIPEPELMLEEEQARAYAQADFEEPHNRFIELFGQLFPEASPEYVLDLGCWTRPNVWRSFPRSRNSPWDLAEATARAP